VAFPKTTETEAMLYLNCEVIAFPLTRRVIVQRLARELYAYRPETAERRLVDHLNRERQLLRRQGVPPDLVERQIQALERAVRDALWQLTLYGGGDAA
jgi:hypothetical protein